MKNTIRILATDALKTTLESAGKNYQIELDCFDDSDMNLVEKIACIQPDVVVMNLFTPHQDAIEVIKAYKTLYSDSFTYFAVICPFVTGRLQHELEECGVRRLICHGDCNRELRSMLAEVSQLKTTPLASARSTGTHAVHRLHHRVKLTHSDDVNELVAAIDEVLEALGLNECDAGGKYLRRAVMLAACGEEGTCQITKAIYPTVAGEFGTTPSSVERRIRCAIEKAWRSEHSAVLAAYFGYTVDNMRGKPSNGEFIAMLADRIRLDISSRSASV